jgi:plastocyanin
MHSVSSRLRHQHALIALLTAAALFICLPAAATAADYRGKLSGAGIVWITDGSRPAATPETVMTNKGKTFVPEMAVINAGSKVRFPNEDGFFHSIYSESTSDPFDLGFYDTGPGKVVPFGHGGVVEVHCHIHGSMHATIVVVDGPWTRITAGTHTFVLHNVRSGRHRLHVWTATHGEKISTVTV